MKITTTSNNNNSISNNGNNNNNNKGGGKTFISIFYLGFSPDLCIQAML